LRPASSQQKIDKSFPPSGVLKWTIPIGKRPKKRPKKNWRAFPLLLRVKIKEFRPASSQKKIGERFPPSGVLKSTIPIGKRPEKRPKKK